MPKRRLSNSKGQHRRSRSGRKKILGKKTLGQKKLAVLRFIGVSLSGGKNDKTCVTILEFYPEYRKIFVKEIFDKIYSNEETSQDKSLLEILNKKDSSVKYVAIDSPITLPNCLLHQCQGVEKCKDATTKWHWAQFKKNKKKKKNLKMFTPYTERCVERYINYELEDFFEIPEALGSNKAPVTARSVYLKTKINKKLLEVFPKLSVHRIGQKFKFPKDDLKFYRHSVHGGGCRASFLQSLIEKDLLFIYDQDLQKLVESPNAFDSMICALTAYLYFFDQCEKPSKGFPTTEGWIQFPKIDPSF